MTQETGHMNMREEIEKRLAEVRRRREEAEAEAARAADNLIRAAGGVTPLIQTDPEEVRAAADAFAAAVERLRLMEDFARTLRGLLM
jgi:alkanesulfonate monooxygenase SsuD/methylene tetrahydromethanopterin reductase-like flavin-dependent oxidoreductase (luciferase family)